MLANTLPRGKIRVKPEIYLDNNATTYLSGAVRATLSQAISEDFGNASSEHRSGEKARRAINPARDNVARFLGASVESIVFGSGATELNYWVISHLVRGGQHPHLVTTQTEHSCVLETATSMEAEGVHITRLPVKSDGRVNLESLSSAVNERTSLVSMQWVNNETGVVQPVHEVARICVECGVPFHCDAAQAMGRLDIDFIKSGFDYITGSAHKMHGPAGVGVLCVKDLKTINPLLRGGNQEHGLRPGTENILGIIGLGRAASDSAESFKSRITLVKGMRDKFETRILTSLPQVEINGSTEHRVGNTTNMMFPGIDGAAIVALLDREGIRCSQSSACTSNRPEPSYVLRAMGLSEEESFASVRFSFSNQNTMAEVEIAASKLISVVGQLSDFRSRRATTDKPQGAEKHEV